MGKSDKYMVICALIYPSLCKYSWGYHLLDLNFLMYCFLKNFSLNSFSIVFSSSPVSTFLFSEIYRNLELLSLVPFTFRDLFLSWKCEAHTEQFLIHRRHRSSRLNSPLVRQEQCQGPSAVWQSAVDLKQEELPLCWHLVGSSTVAFWTRWLSVILPPIPFSVLRLTRQNKPALTKEGRDLLSRRVITRTAELLSMCGLINSVCSKPEVPGGCTQEIHPDCVQWFGVLGPGRQNG